MTLSDKISHLAELAAKCAKEKRMSAKIWKQYGEIRVYLSRTNAAR